MGHKTTIAFQSALILAIVVFFEPWGFYKMAREILSYSQLRNRAGHKELVKTMPTKELLEMLLLAVAMAITLATQAQETAVPVAAPLDEIVLKNGSLILGTVTSARDGVVVIETDFAGPLSIAFESVQSMTTLGSQVFQLTDGTVIRDQPLVIDGEKLQITTDSGE